MSQVLCCSTENDTALQGENSATLDNILKHWWHYQLNQNQNKTLYHKMLTTMTLPSALCTYTTFLGVTVFSRTSGQFRTGCNSEYWQKRIGSIFGHQKNPKKQKTRLQQSKAIGQCFNGIAVMGMGSTVGMGSTLGMGSTIGMESTMGIGPLWIVPTSVQKLKRWRRTR